MRRISRYVAALFIIAGISLAGVLTYNYVKPYFTKEPEVTTVSTTTVKKEDVLAKYRAIYKKNPDFVGWVKIDGTPIDYAVMQNKADNEYYLKKNIDKKYSYYGSIFLDIHSGIDPLTTNLLLHGHNMKNDKMFGSLIKYKKESYYKEHKIINFDTIFKQGKYEIVAVFTSKVFKKTDKVFKYYKFFQAKDEEDFNDFITNIKKLSLYDTGVTAKYGDQLLTLSTCDYAVKDGRMVIVARKIKQ